MKSFKEITNLNRRNFLINLHKDAHHFALEHKSLTNDKCTKASMTKHIKTNLHDLYNNKHYDKWQDINDVINTTVAKFYK